MLLRYPKWKINVIIWTLVSVLSVSSVCLVLLVVLPNIPNSSGRLSVTGQFPRETSLVLFVFGVVANVVCVIAICCLIAWWIRARNKNNCDSINPITVKSQLKYNTEEPVVERRLSHFNKHSIQDKVKRNGACESYQNYGFEDDGNAAVGEGGKGGVLPHRAASFIASPRSSFAEDLYRSFKNIQSNSQLGQDSTLRRPTSSGRSFLESVDEEGYHFDNIEFSDQSEDENEIEINSEFKPPLKRLDTFDRNILDAVENLQKRIALDSQADLEEEEEDEEVFKSKLERSMTQDSFKGLEHLRAFNAKYLSLVHVDSVPSFLENEPKGSFFNDSTKGGDSFFLTSLPSNSADKKQRSEGNPSARTSSESSDSSSVGGKNSPSELEWDVTTTELTSIDTKEEATRF